MGVRNPVGQAVGSARVVGDIAADGADLLTRRIRSEVKAGPMQVPREI